MFGVPKSESIPNEKIEEEGRLSYDFAPQENSV
jgi:hypothetical protein